ncbi:MAG: metal ABC transporter ATP-binding protein [Nitrospirae bacterium]|nr:metal ABC transporter ATP-binding protein [Nitrospirota bacterium]
MNPPSPIIRFSNATLAYPRGIALQNVTLNVAPGEFLGIIGPNGSGKTTLLKAVLGLLKPVEGTVQIFDCSCHELRCHHRARIGYLPQKEQVDPNFPITVMEAVMMGRYGALGLFHRPGKKDRDLALHALEEVEMEPFRNAPLGHLSGGQQQRILIARALAQNPEVLLLDEPTTGIDAPTQHSIVRLISKLHRDLKLTILLVTHDINMISPFTDRIALINRKLFAVGPPREVLTQETLSEIYGKQVIVTTKGEGTFVIVGDYHHA